MGGDGRGGMGTGGARVGTGGARVVREIHEV